MTDQLLELLTVYGLPAAALVLAVAQFGVPLPTSLALLTLGALAANGDTELSSAFAWAMGGVVAGDQAGFLAGRVASRSVREGKGFLARMARKARLAEPFMQKWGSGSVFLTRWLVTPLGPAVNIAGGATGLSWAGFTAWSVAGEAVWVSIYLALGHVFGSNIETLAGILGNLSMALAMLAVAALLGWRLARAIRKGELAPKQDRKDDADDRATRDRDARSGTAARPR